MINRKEYLDKLISWKDEKVIKVITGIRRCGKSTLLELFKNYLISSGVKEKQIIIVNFEKLEFENLLDYKALYEYLSKKFVKGKNNYILLDEIQKVVGFEKVVDSLYVQDGVDIYITGSNSYLLSGELSTLLSGRYVEISMLPLSFKEYFEINNTKSKEESFNDYMTFGSFPYVATMQKTKEKVNDYLEGIYNTVIVKDIEDRQKRKDLKNTFDVTLLKTLSKYLADIIGNPISVKGIKDYISSNERKVSDHTIGDYIESLKQSFIFYQAERYDIKGKELLKTNSKYYIVDTGLRNYLISKKGFDLGFVLENIVYLELLRRNYTVRVGKSGTKEIDFIATKNGVVEYYQVSANLTDETTFKREISVLQDINDNYPKTILTLDNFTLGNYNGIEVKNVIDWLLNFN